MKRERAMSGLQLQSSQREAVIVAVNANRTRGSVEAVEWALKHVVKPGDIFLVLGVFNDQQAKKSSCFPFKLLMGLGVFGIWKRLEFVDHEEVDPVELEEEFERKREEYRSSLQPLYRQCSKNEVRLLLKLAAGFCPARLAIKESQNLNTRWIVLDRRGFPRVFSYNELEVITNSVADDSIISVVDGITVHKGILQETPVLVKSLQITNKGFWSIIEILSRVCYRNVMNLVGYSSTGVSAFLLFDFPCLGTVEMNLQCDELAKKLEWGARWSIALEIGGSLRYLHEECVDGPIVHKNVRASSVALSLGYSAMALPLLEIGEFGKLMDCRLKETAGDARMARHMAHAALRLKVDSDHKLSISEAIAIVRGDELAIFNH